MINIIMWFRDMWCYIMYLHYRRRRSQTSAIYNWHVKRPYKNNSEDNNVNNWPLHRQIEIHPSWVEKNHGKITTHCTIPGLAFPLDGFGGWVGVDADGHQFWGSVWSKIDTIVIFRIHPLCISICYSRLPVHLALVPLHHDVAGSREPIFESRGGYPWAPTCTMHDGPLIRLIEENKHTDNVDLLDKDGQS
jgi:hypothetical protein